MPPKELSISNSHQSYYSRRWRRRYNRAYCRSCALTKFRQNITTTFRSFDFLWAVNNILWVKNISVNLLRKIYGVNLLTYFCVETPYKLNNTTLQYIDDFMMLIWP